MEDKKLFSYIDGVNLTPDMKKRLVQTAENAGNDENAHSSFARRNLAAIGGAAAALCLAFGGGFYLLNGGEINPLSDGGGDVTEEERTVTETDDAWPYGEVELQVDDATFGYDDFIGALDALGVVYEGGPAAGGAGFLSVEPKSVSVWGDSFDVAEWGVNATVIEPVFVYEYATNGLMEADAALIDRSGYPISAYNLSVSSPYYEKVLEFVNATRYPHWYKKGEVVVFYSGENGDITDILSGVFGGEFAGYDLMKKEFLESGAYRKLTEEDVEFHQAQMEKIRASSYVEDLGVFVQYRAEAADRVVFEFGDWYFDTSETSWDEYCEYVELIAEKIPTRFIEIVPRDSSLVAAIKERVALDDDIPVYCLSRDEHTAWVAFLIPYTDKALELDTLYLYKLELNDQNAMVVSDESLMNKFGYDGGFWINEYAWINSDNGKTVYEWGVGR